MREIKFRAWNKDKKVMVYTDEDESSNYWDGDVASDIELVNHILSKNYLSKNYDENYEWMQFTGLYDKNGTEIYEDDIVKFCHWRDCDINKKREWQIGYIEYHHDRFSLRPKQPMDSLYESKMYEVIGNKWENSELLSL